MVSINVLVKILAITSFSCVLFASFRFQHLQISQEWGGDCHCLRASKNASSVDEAPAPVYPLSPAYEESLYFFDDISADEWAMLKAKVKSVAPNVKYPNDTKIFRNAATFYLENYEPDFACRHERRIGRLGDGGKWVCDPHRMAKARNESESISGDSARAPRESPSCLVYSVGSSGDFSFEESIFKDIGTHCEIHTFDFGNFGDRGEKAGVNYHQWGLGARNEVRAGPRNHTFKTLEETVKELGHTNRVVDIFKIDCEGCEWSTYQSWFEAPITLRQVLIELHRVVVPNTTTFFKRMYQEGYVIFHKEANLRSSGKYLCIEYAFLKLDQTLFS